jgi:prolyl 4-hydroxylase
MLRCSLKAMTVDFGAYNETFYAYVTPDVATFYNETPGSRAQQNPRFRGLFGKFINLGPETIRVYWVPDAKGEDPVYISDVEPFGSAGTATYPNHNFIVTTTSDVNKVLTRWTINAGESLYYYDPFGSPQKAVKALNEEQMPLYGMQYVNKLFAEQYKKITGRDYLALYKQKMPPRFHMWRPEAIGDTFTIETKEIHFVDLPPAADIDRGASAYGPRPDQIAQMRKYRAKYPTMNLTLTALSCAPRVFEIQNFLSDLEVAHLLDIAAKKKLTRSSTKSGEGSQETAPDRTRTSTNDWIGRGTDIITDAIYRRAADILQMDEALLRWRRASEIPEFPESMISVSERLQLVHYDVGQQYTPHHDFTMPPLVAMQPSRFATVLFYLNDDMKGGETSFPRWLNSETREALKVKPEKGKAILFYNILPDGNYDERSQHAAMPVTEGEKWLTNLWVWDPVLDHTAEVDNE